MTWRRLKGLLQFYDARIESVYPFQLDENISFAFYNHIGDLKY